MKDLSSIKCLEGQLQERRSTQLTLTFRDLKSRLGLRRSPGVDLEISLRDLILMSENGSEGVSKRKAHRIQLEIYESSYIGLVEAGNVLIHTCRAIEILKSRGVASTGVSVLLKQGTKLYSSSRYPS